MSFGPSELMIILLLWVIPVVVNIAGLVDAASRPDPAWQRAGQNKTLWIVLLAIGLFSCLVGLVLGIVYFAVIRPTLVRAVA